MQPRAFRQEFSIQWGIPQSWGNYQVAHDRGLNSRVLNLPSSSRNQTVSHPQRQVLPLPRFGQFAKVGLCPAESSLPAQIYCHVDSPHNGAWSLQGHDKPSWSNHVLLMFCRCPTPAYGVTCMLGNDLLICLTFNIGTPAVQEALSGKTVKARASFSGWERWQQKLGALAAYLPSDS